MPKHTFDVELYTSITVEAATEEEARAKLRDQIHGADVNFGAWENGDPITSEVGLYDDGITLSESIEGEVVG